MNRRSFFERTSALIGIVVGAPVAQASTASPVELQRSPVAGFQYHRGEALWPLLTVGASLDLVREPDNPHETHAPSASTGREKSWAMSRAWITPR